MEAKLTNKPATVQNVASRVNTHVFLTGRPPIPEYVGFIKSMAINGQFLNDGQLIDEWRKGNARVMEIEAKEKGAADCAAIIPISEDLKHLERQVLTSPIFQASFSSFPSEIGVVDLDQVVVYQKFINLTYVESLVQSLGEKPSSEGVFELALGLTRMDPPVKSMRTGPNAFTFISPSNDFRFLEVLPVSPEQIPNELLNGYPSSVFAIVMGYGSNCLNVLSIGNRLILNNGSHRAYALYKLGIKKVPCIIQQIQTKDELELTGNQELIKNLDRYVTHPRPPMLKDYFDPQLIKLVEVQAKNRMVRFQFGLEQVDVPAT